MYPTYYHKTDKDGRPVYFEELGKVDLVKMLKITTQERMLKTWYGNMKPCVNIVYLHVQEKLVI